MSLAGLIIADPQPPATNPEYLRVYAPLLITGSCLILAFLMLCMLVHQATKSMRGISVKPSMIHQAMAVLGLRKDFDVFSLTVDVQRQCFATRPN